MMRDKKELEKSLRYFRHKAEYTVESDERKEMYAIAAEAVEKVLNPDFVEVVRCKECRYFRITDDADGRYFDCRVDCMTDVEPNAYCSYAERWEEG